MEIKFAHRSFKWSNLAKSNAAVTCVIVGMGIADDKPKRLFDGDIVRDVDLIGPYLAPNVKTIITGRTRAKGPIAKSLETMIFGNMALDGRNEKCLRMSRTERDDILSSYPSADKFLRPIFGSDELMDGKDLWCIWVRSDQVDEANAIEPFRNRFEALGRVRMSNDAGADMRKAAATPWSFREQNEASSHTIIVPGAASEDRFWLPVDVKDRRAIVSNLAFGIFDGAIWQASILSSRLHRLWLETVGGRLKEDPRYSNTLVWNTFLLPSLSERRKAELEEHWWEIDLARKEAGIGRSLAELYAPKNMPRPLRHAHEELDATMETIFGSRRYRSDADRIEHMLQLYERMVAEEESGQPSRKSKTKATA